MQELVGKIITEVALSNDKEDIRFTDEQGNFYCYHAYADCCSESWFSDIIQLHDLLGNLVVEVIEKEEEKDLPGTRQDVDTLYGYTLKTVQGYCDINFRNSSNGYYGGNCFYAVYPTYNVSYIPVTGDFSS